MFSGRSMFVNTKNIPIARGNENASIIGRLLPNLVCTLSAMYPITGFTIAFHMDPTAAIVPAVAGEIPAIVVRKNSKNTPMKPYAVASPRDANPYPIFSTKVVFCIIYPFALVLTNTLYHS